MDAFLIAAVYLPLAMQYLGDLLLCQVRIHPQVLQALKIQSASPRGYATIV